MAQVVYIRKLETESLDAAEQWKQNHSHVIQVILCENDGYIDSFDNEGHINFAPFKKFDYSKSMIRENMNGINYQEAVKVGVLQGDAGGEQVVLFREAHARFCIKIYELGNEVYAIQGVTTNDLAKYIKRHISLRQLGKKYNTEIRDIPLYAYYKKEYAVDGDRVLRELERLNTKDYQSLIKRLTLKLILST